MSDNGEGPSAAHSKKYQSRVLITVLVYIALLIDNILLTVIGNNSY